MQEVKSFLKLNKKKENPRMAGIKCKMKIANGIVNVPEMNKYKMFYRIEFV